jgi:hypothetical protein
MRMTLTSNICNAQCASGQLVAQITTAACISDAVNERRRCAASRLTHAKTTSEKYVSRCAACFWQFTARAKKRPRRTLCRGDTEANTKKRE